MRVSLFALLVLTLSFYFCTKKNDITNNTTKSYIKITSITPVNVYTDESITINGVGFNVDKSKDTIDFGRLDEKSDDDTTLVFKPYYKSHPNDYIITDASVTQLVIKPNLPDSLYKVIFPKNTIATVKVNFRVRSNGAVAISNAVMFKDVPKIYTSLTSDYPMFPNDSAEAIITGVYSNNICDVSLYLSCTHTSGCDFANQYINSNLSYVPEPCDCDDFGTLVYGCGPEGVNRFSHGRLVSYDSINKKAVVNFLVPANLLGTTVGGGYGPVINIKAKAINKDGRSGPVAILPIQIFPTH